MFPKYFSKARATYNVRTRLLHLSDQIEGGNRSIVIYFSKNMAKTQTNFLTPVLMSAYLPNKTWCIKYAFMDTVTTDAISNKNYKRKVNIATLLEKGEELNNSIIRLKFKWCYEMVFFLSIMKLLSTNWCNISDYLWYL